VQQPRTAQARPTRPELEGDPIFQAELLPHPNPNRQNRRLVIAIATALLLFGGIAGAVAGGISASRKHRHTAQRLYISIPLNLYILLKNFHQRI
jgi:hypothetical protein